MSNTPTKYKWLLSSTACSSCQQMATDEYDTKPDRPHSYCQCTIVSITPNSYNGPTDPLPRIVSVEQTGGHTDYDEGSHKSVEELKESGRENFSAKGEYYFDVTVRCPKNNQIILNIVIQVEDGELYDVIMNWSSLGGDPESETQLDNWPPAKDEFEQEIMDAIADYSGGLEFKALTKARAILASEGKEFCAM